MLRQTISDYFRNYMMHSQEAIRDDAIHRTTRENTFSIYLDLTVLLLGYEIKP